MVGTNVPPAKRNRVIACRRALIRTEDLKGVWALLVCRCHALRAVECRLSLRVMPYFFYTECFCKFLMCIKFYSHLLPWSSQPSRSKARALSWKADEELSGIFFYHAWEIKLTCCLLLWVTLPFTLSKHSSPKRHREPYGFKQACLSTKSNVQIFMPCKCSCRDGFQYTVQWASPNGAESIFKEIT